MDTAANASLPVAGPAPSASRLLAIDVTRGFALLGIFFVNIQSFAEPFGRFISPVPESDDPLTALCFYFVKIFCEGKFYPLFSMLFGMGLALQMHSIRGRGGNFYAIYIRRQLWLFLMGLAHALLFWYGDILFIYSIVGLVLMLCIRIPPRVLLGIGAGIVLLASVLHGAFGALSGIGASMQQHSTAAVSSPTSPVTPEAAAAADPAATQVDDQTADRQTTEAPDQPVTHGPNADAPPLADASAPADAQLPFWRFLNAMSSGKGGPPDQGIWLEAEIESYRHGPWSQSFLFRLMSWLMILGVSLFGFGWHILAMFLIGAGLLRMGLFTDAGERWQIRLFLLGLLVGLPGSIVSAMLPSWAGITWWSLGLSGFLLMLCGPLVSLFYLMSFSLLVRRGIAQPLTFVLSRVGRMALTVYLSETLISTFVFYHWGLAQFASWTRPERCAFVLCVYIGLCIFSVLWMHTFRFGPMEWLWRTVTYLHPQPMRRSRASAEPV